MNNLSLNELNIAAQFYKPIPYDPRYSVAMSEQEFNNYKTNVGHTYYLYLYNLVKILKPNNILELGTSIGRSALFMLTALDFETQKLKNYPIGHLKSNNNAKEVIEIIPELILKESKRKLTTIEMGSFLRGDLAAFSDDNRLNIIYGNTTDPSTYEPLNLKDIDFLYMDTEHSYECISKEWSIYKNFLKDGALVVMDDISLNNGMIKFWNELFYNKLDTGKDIHFSGFGIFEYNKEI